MRSFIWTAFMTLAFVSGVQAATLKVHNYGSADAYITVFDLNAGGQAVLNHEKVAGGGGLYDGGSISTDAGKQCHAYLVGIDVSASPARALGKEISVNGAGGECLFLWSEGLHARRQHR